MEYNNFIYRVDLMDATDKVEFKQSNQPFTSIPPNGTTSIVFRISNPCADGVNNTNRVENEVAALHLSRSALAAGNPSFAHIVPAIYDWKTNSYPSPADETSYAWIMMELRPGVPLDSKFDGLPFDEKKALLGKIAGIFATIQKAELPKGIDSHGGMTIKNGEIISGQSTTVKGGPWKSYEAWWAGRLHQNLTQAETSLVLDDWKANGIRLRVDDFLATGIPDLLRDIDPPRLAIAHGDISES
jgi:hypothetical protein